MTFPNISKPYVSTKKRFPPWWKISENMKFSSISKSRVSSTAFKNMKRYEIFWNILNSHMFSWTIANLWRDMILMPCPRPNGEIPSMSCANFNADNPPRSTWIHQESIKMFPSVYKGIKFMRLLKVFFHQQQMQICDNKFVQSFFLPFQGIWGDFPDFQLNWSYLYSQKFSKLFPFVYLINHEKRNLKCL